MSRTVSQEFKKPILYSRPWAEPTPAPSLTAAPLTAAPPTVVGSASGKRRSGAVISNLLPGQKGGSGLQTDVAKLRQKEK